MIRSLKSVPGREGTMTRTCLPSAFHRRPATRAASMPTTTMPRTNGNATSPNGNGNGRHQEATAKPAIEAAFEKIETIKGSYREAIRGLNDLADTLKQVQREQKGTDKEVQSIRVTLEKLQSVRI